MKVSGRILEILIYVSARPRDAFSGAQLSKALGISSGTLYPALLKLEKAGMVDGDWELGDPAILKRPRRKFYRVTGVGIRAAEERMSVLSPGFKAATGSTGFGEQSA